MSNFLQALKIVAMCHVVAELGDCPAWFFSVPEWRSVSDYLEPPVFGAEYRADTGIVKNLSHEFNTLNSQGRILVKMTTPNA